MEAGSSGSNAKLDCSAVTGALGGGTATGTPPAASASALANCDCCSVTDMDASATDELEPERSRGARWPLGATPSITAARPSIVCAVRACGGGRWEVG